MDLLAVPVGGDSYAQIGPASGSGSESASIGSPDRFIEDWTRQFNEYFPPQTRDRELAVNLEEMQLTAEPSIDRYVATKTEELRRRQRELELQLRLQAAERKR